MERLIERGEMLKVEKKRRLAKQRKRAQKRAHRVLHTETNERARTDKLDVDTLATLWTQIESDVDAVLRGDVPPTANISPMNMLLEVSDEQFQCVNCCF